MGRGSIKGVPVLMYHALESPERPAGAKDAGEQRYVLRVAQFSDHLEYLHQGGFKTFLLEKLLELEKWPDKAVAITFDDGHESNFFLALPLLRKYGFKADFFITTDWIGTDSYMTTDQIKVMHEFGMGIGSHGVTHNFLSDMNDGEMERELRKSMEILSGITRGKIASFSAPGGRSRPGMVAAAVRLGYRVVCISQPGVLEKGDSALSIPRLALRRDTDMETYKFMVHGEQEYINKMLRRYNLLLFAKKGLKVNWYERLRKCILKKI